MIKIIIDIDKLLEDTVELSKVAYTLTQDKIDIDMFLDQMRK